MYEKGRYRKAGYCTNICSGQGLYVELATWEMAEFTRSFTTAMRRGTTGEDRVEVVKYIPQDLFVRFKTINSIGNQARLDSNKTTNFRVSFGKEDFILQQKTRGSKGWGLPLSLPANLPPFEHHLPVAPGHQVRLQAALLSPRSRPGRGTGRCPLPLAPLHLPRRPLTRSWMPPTW